MADLMGKWHLIAPQSWSSLILEIQLVSLASNDKPHSLIVELLPFSQRFGSLCLVSLPLLFWGITLLDKL